MVKEWAKSFRASTDATKKRTGHSQPPYNQGAYGGRTTMENKTVVNTKSPIAEKRREGPTDARQPTSKAETRLMNTPYTSKKNN